ncbi:hypothetical protein DFH11DRAFT_1544302 [Phellopilus nigrolimitatus]|nr:hypothetical protein DFH11DRAFT_1544302 [Phellopilus nigrolimitatus]
MHSRFSMKRLNALSIMGGARAVADAQVPQRYRGEFSGRRVPQQQRRHGRETELRPQQDKLGKNEPYLHANVARHVLKLESLFALKVKDQTVSMGGSDVPHGRLLGASVRLRRMSQGMAMREGKSKKKMKIDGTNPKTFVTISEHCDKRLRAFYQCDSLSAHDRALSITQPGLLRWITIPSAGTEVALLSAIPHIAHFCNTLPRILCPVMQPTYNIEQPGYLIGYHSFPPEIRQSTILMLNPGPYGTEMTLPRPLPYDKHIYETEEVHATNKAARCHVVFKVYVVLYHAGLPNEHLLPLSGSTSPLQAKEIKNLTKDVKKCEGQASVREQMYP